MQAADLAATADPEKTGQLDSSKAGLVLNIVNNSSHDLQWVSSGDSRYTPTSPSKQVVPANGGTDRIVFQNSNIGLHLTLPP